MKNCVIFCAGEFGSLLQPVGENDVVIAADGGLRHTQALGLEPDVILGDFDSLGYVPQGAQVFPVEKDDTDSMLAVRKGLQMGCRRFILYGALDGPRLDHTLANLQTLCFLKAQGAAGFLAGMHTVATVISEETLEFPQEMTGVLSLFCMGEEAHVTIRNLQYQLENGTLTADFPLGVSNHFVGKAASVTVSGGKVIALYDGANGLVG